MKRGGGKVEIIVEVPARTMMTTAQELAAATIWQTQCPRCGTMRPCGARGCRRCGSLEPGR